ncbi:MAG: diacylglycerol/lipid kinase family protein [Sphingomonadales bacterium]
MTIHVIVNPASRNGGTLRRWHKLAPKIEATLGRFKTEFTERPGHATELARQALKAGAGRIIVVGGDGTLHEVVNGFFEHGAPINPHAVLGLLPIGTGADFARSLGLPKHPEAQIGVLHQARTRRIDVGLVRCRDEDGEPYQRYFANLSSFGLSARVAGAVNSAKLPKRLGGPFAYALPALQALVSHHNSRLRLTFDGGRMQELTSAFVVAANGRYCGGGLKLAPESELADGQLDVIVVGDIGVLDGVAYIGRVYKGTHLRHPKIDQYRTTRLVAEALDPAIPVAIEADGEAFGALPAEIEILPRALKVIVAEMDGETE